MNDFEFPKRGKKEIGELNIVPILDMFISIVFFLILSASMVGMTKLVLPPSATSSIESGSQKVPLNVKLILLSQDQKSSAIKALLKWEGSQPGSDFIILKNDIFKEEKEVVKKINEMISRFKTQYPDEKTIQISLQSRIPYQWLISAMDSAREILPDVVLNSYSLADSMKD